MTDATERALTPTSYLVLGLLARQGPCTPYQLKQQVHQTVGLFWSFPHSQLYAEPRKLTRDGLLEETQEEQGRRRRFYAITEQGRLALQSWLGEPSDALIEVRALGLLKLFFGDQATGEQREALAQMQAETHGELADRLEELEKLASSADPGSSTHSLLLLGARTMRTIAEFWDEQQLRLSGGQKRG